MVEEKLGDKEQVNNQEYFDNVNSDISQVEVQAIFEIGRSNIPLYDFDKLVEGYTFILDSKVDNYVHVTVNGKCIATGVLVNVNNKLGVRIIKVFI